MDKRGMLVLKRKDGQEIEVTHTESGDILRFRVYDIQPGKPGRVSVAFSEHHANGSLVEKDESFLFNIHRPERQEAARAEF